MAIGGGNAEASSSSSRALMGARGKGGDPEILFNRAKSPVAGGSQRAMSPASEGTKGAPSRRVWTVPPSAVYDPPTPPASSHSPRPLTSTSADMPSTSRPIRPRPRIRYSTSESSAGESDASSDDDEPPWWLFTQRGVAKMRARSMRKKGDVEMGMGETNQPRESGRERRESRASRERDKSGSASSTRLPNRRSASDLKGSTPASGQNGRLLHPLPIRGLSSQRSFLFRRTPNGDVPQIAVERPRVRSNSAPSSPIQASDAPSPGMTMLVADTDEPRHLRELTQEKASLPRRAMSPKRHLTMPVMPGENLTDSEAMPVSPRLRSRAKGNESPHYFQDLAVPPSTSTMNGFFTPTRPQGKRRQSTRPRLNIPPPITQHFAHGWPHAGSWQDALYGYYDEDPNSGPSRKGSGEGAQKKASRKRFVTREASELESAPVSTASPARPKRIRTRSRRTKRYRQALTPPTPAGLGFVTSGEGWKEGRVGGQGFDWNAASRQEPSMDIEEEDGLSRSETRATSNMNEKGKVESPAKKQPWWRIMRGRQQKPIRKVEEVEWRKRMRRILFLDARLTIWIRAFNLAVVIVLLALAIIIRLDLSKLHLPGLIGSSTTLIIIYSCPTILHVLTAIYREYFGKPIGLWGLRSKMLWVCLDLLFVALWSSAMSSATNDYIGTPLECTPGSPWWRGGLGEECAKLLAEKQLLNSTSAPDEMAVTSISMISHPLGFVLPAEVLLLQSGVVHEICRRQAGCIALALVALSLYGGNMVLSLFRIFETVRRTANMGKAVNT